MGLCRATLRLVTARPPEAQHRARRSTPRARSIRVALLTWLCLQACNPQDFNTLAEPASTAQLNGEGDNDPGASYQDPDPEALTGGQPGDGGGGGDTATPDTGGTDQAPETATGGQAGAGTGGQESTSETGGQESSGGADGTLDGGVQDASEDTPTSETEPNASCGEDQPAHVLLCDDFENASLSAQWQTFSTPGAANGETSRVDTPGPSPRSSGALYSIAPAGQESGGPLFADTLGAITSGSIHVRAWLYFTESIATLQSRSWAADLLNLGQSQAEGSLSLTISGANLALAVYSANGDGAYEVASRYAALLPTERWVCVQFDFPVGDQVSSANMHLAINEEALSPATATKPIKTTFVGGYERFWVGIVYADSARTVPTAVYYDDVAVGTAPIPCESVE